MASVQSAEQNTHQQQQNAPSGADGNASHTDVSDNVSVSGPGSQILNGGNIIDGATITGVPTNTSQATLQSQNYQYSYTSNMPSQSGNVSYQQQQGGMSVYPTGATSPTQIGSSNLIPTFQTSTSPVTTVDGGIQMTTGYSSYQSSQQITGSAPMYRSQSATTETSRVVGHEFGTERVISVSSRRDESRTQIVSERFVEHEVKVPKRVIREEVIEKVIIVPEIVRVEEIVEEIAKVKERIIEISHPTIVEKLVERPEYEYVEKTIEVPEKVIKEKIKEVERVVIQEQINEVVKIIPIEKIVEVPDIQIREVLVEKIVEVPEFREEVIIKEIPVPQYVDKIIPEIVQVPVPVDINRTMPVPVEAVVNYEYKLPIIKPKYKQVYYPVYIPTFKEIPVAIELLESSGLLEQAENHLAQINLLASTNASLAEVEKLATNVMDQDLVRRLQQSDLQSAVLKAWQNTGGPSTQVTTMSSTQQQQVYRQSSTTNNHITTTTSYQASSMYMPSSTGPAATAY